MRTRKSNSRRRGAISHEMTVSLLLASAVVLGVAQIASFVVQQCRGMDSRAAAHRAAGNVMESMMARPFDELTPEAIADQQAGELGEAELAGARWTVAVADEPDSPAKRITVEINWAANSQPQTAPVRLVAWRYPTAEATP